jgi:hypothetical protein
MSYINCFEVQGVLTNKNKYVLIQSEITKHDKKENDRTKLEIFC